MRAERLGGAVARRPLRHYEISMAAADIPDRTLMGVGGKIRGEDHPIGILAMSDFACFALAFMLFGVAALYAHACGRL